MRKRTPCFRLPADGRDLAPGEKGPSLKETRPATVVGATEPSNKTLHQSKRPGLDGFPPLAKYGSPRAKEGFSRVASFRDPDGNQFEVVEFNHEFEGNWDA